jgi:hypothetical protein
MRRMERTARGSGGRSFIFVAWAAACGGSVDSGDQSKANGGTGGSAVSPVGGAGGSLGAAAGSVGGTSSGGAVGSSAGGVGGTLGYGGSFGCFVAGTPIATPSGAVAIEELRLGDLVLAYDERTGHVIPRPVTATFVHPDHAVGALPLSDGRVLCGYGTVIQRPRFVSGCDCVEPLNPNPSGACYSEIPSSGSGCEK